MRKDNTIWYINKRAYIIYIIAMSYDIAISLKIKR